MSRSSSAPIHHAAIALDLFTLCQPQEMPDMIDTGLITFMGLFLIFGEEDRQFALL